MVDDDESNRESLRRRLERRGYSVTVAANGQAALNCVAAAAFDLIILDVMMPGISGLDVLKQLRAVYSPAQLPIIMATAKDQSENVVEALDLGANDYVTKPLDFAVVSARVRTHLQLKQSVDRILALESNLRMRNAELQRANIKLLMAAERTSHDLQAAAKVQQAFLPHANPHIVGARFSWVFEPCAELAGDSLNVVQLDNNTVGLYVLDVSGHGVAASLLAVAVTRLLSPSAGGESLVLHMGADGIPHPAGPSEVATHLNQSFPIDATHQFITLFYAVYNSQTHKLTYVSAGHPGAVRVSRGSAPVILNGTGLPIGVGDEYEHQTVHLQGGDRIYLYSDGVTEAMNAERMLFGTDRLLSSLSTASEVPLTESISRIQTEIARWRGGASPRDDISILGMECP